MLHLQQFAVMNGPRKKGVILMNLGSPASTEVKDVRSYLNEFLMDAKVIDKPWLLRALLVKGIIVPFRAPKTAEAYKTIWTNEGSPLMALTRKLQHAVQQQVKTPVTIAMRYGSPSPDAAFQELLKQEPELEEVLLVPLYPHYAMSSFETAVDYAKEIHRKKKYKFSLTVVPPYYQNRQYLEALADSIKPYLGNDYDHILFSYHGIPERHIRKSDVTGSHCLNSPNCCEVPSAAHAYCYRHQIKVTTRKVTAMLNIPAEKWSISFQSRLGKGWLQPFTDVVLEELPAKGIKKLLILCPAFVSDCLETLEEIEERGKESFLNAGGKSYQMIPCLNTNPLWVKTVATWIDNFAQKPTAPLS
jgi:protoporphyrin/coproporphyrin ferrochelatase